MIKLNIFQFSSKPEDGCHGGFGTVRVCRVLHAEFQSQISFLDYTVLPPGASIGYHRHLDTEEVYVVLQGTGVMTVDGEVVQVVRGDVVLNRRGGSHGLENNGVEDLAVLVFEGRF